MFQKLITLPGPPHLMVEIRDDSEPQGWHWGEGSPGLLNGLSVMPMVMIGQTVSTALSCECVDEEDWQFAISVIDLMNKRIQRGLKTMWALHRDPAGDGYRMAIYFPNEEGLEIFERKVCTISGHEAHNMSRTTRLFL
ncbi:hypothetical protein [Sphingobium sp. KCTC 72723]|uniref:hypothetical protein n=1 Tax=Sphingobium sp. KCTC 72723 TaxID=2733867 RepID=UPI00165E1EF7|nr:hypothetical protein [Sphingobium sp. KCTC 72723]